MDGVFELLEKVSIEWKCLNWWVYLKWNSEGEVSHMRSRAWFISVLFGAFYSEESFMQPLNQKTSRAFQRRTLILNCSFAVPLILFPFLLKLIHPLHPISLIQWPPSWYWNCRGRNDYQKVLSWNYEKLYHSCSSPMTLSVLNWFIQLLNLLSLYFVSFCRWYFELKEQKLDVPKYRFNLNVRLTRFIR